MDEIKIKAKTENKNNNKEDLKLKKRGKFKKIFLLTIDLLIE